MQYGRLVKAISAFLMGFIRQCGWWQTKAWINSLNVQKRSFRRYRTKKLIKPIEKLQQGKSSEAEKMIIDYEQRGIAPPIYRE